MGTIAVVLKLIILVFFLISTISFFFQKKEAASNTSKMIDELNNDENDQDIEFASQEVIEALQDIYKLSLTEPVRIAYVYGDVELKTLTVNGGTSIIFLIAGGRVEIPASLNADLIKGETHFEALLEDAEDAQVALVDDKLYLVSFGQYALINEQRSNELEQQSPMAAKEIQRGKIGGLPLEVVRERDATDNECLYFDPIKAGKRFAILMILIFVLAPIFIDDDSSVYAWAGIHGGAILVLLPLWYKFSRRQRKSFKVTLMRGEIHQVVSQDWIELIASKPRFVLIHRLKINTCNGWRSLLSCLRLIHFFIRICTEKKWRLKCYQTQLLNKLTHSMSGPLSLKLDSVFKPIKFIEFASLDL